MGQSIKNITCFRKRRLCSLKVRKSKDKRKKRTHRERKGYEPTRETLNPYFRARRNSFRGRAKEEERTPGKRGR